MPYSITDFSHGPYQYLSDDGKKYTVMSRNAIQAVLPAGVKLAAKDGTETGTFSAKRARHVWLEAVVDEVAPGADQVKRKKAIVASINSTGATPGYFIGQTVTGLDGLNWMVTGYVGEKQRGTFNHVSQ